jgi:hypothetical protein
VEAQLALSSVQKTKQRGREDNPSWTKPLYDTLTKFRWILEFAPPQSNKPGSAHLDQTTIYSLHFDCFIQVQQQDILMFWNF